MSVPEQNQASEAPQPTKDQLDALCDLVGVMLSGSCQKRGLPMPEQWARRLERRRLPVGEQNAA